MSIDKLHIDKELSWLSFNERVLQEAADKSNPIIERVRFLGIYSNNFDEFYKVRFADVKRRIIINEEQGGDNSAKHLLNKMQNKATKLAERFDELYNEVLLEMARRNIFLVNEEQLNETQINWLRKYFKTNILPHTSPIILSQSTDLIQFLKDEFTYLAIDLIKDDNKKHALIEIPTEQLDRFVVLPKEKGKRRKTLILIDNIIRLFINEIFAGLFEYDEVNAYAMKMNRDAEYVLTQEVEHGLLEQMSDGLSQRLTQMPVRFVYQHDMPQDTLHVLMDALRVSNYDSVVPAGRYHNHKDFIDFPNVGPRYLENPALPPMLSQQFATATTTFDAIKQKDILLYYPYHSFEHITEWLRQAAYDPKVYSIKINIYRVAKNSRIIESVIDAANNGKQVTVVVELMARFDEQANIIWSKRLTEAGVRVVFGNPGMKIHSKLCVVSRKEEEGIVRYAHIGTGNFHEKTAKIYTDFSLLTADKSLTDEVRAVFDYIENPFRPVKFQQLFVSPRNSRGRIYNLIDNEIANARHGKAAGITLKVNNLVDKGLVNRLYEASQAGVKVRLIIRGMCSLIPGLKGISDNIYAISIIDRFLEHPRVAVFANNGDPYVMITSADWMTRNIDNRVEVGCPIKDHTLKKRIIDILEIQFKDTVKARVIDKDMSNNYVSRGNRRKIRSQIATYDYLKQVERQIKKSVNKEGTVNEQSNPRASS
ncbi:polyphosphate kinase 1 [Thaumasiovibrio sp. DFM-14]|uniref:polyphosphate kinase 1 n=1 Tax=Thaumasiovibrio sp. DFM-14 TaxID=3384792 RepID=UPI0039A3C707